MLPKHQEIQFSHTLRTKKNADSRHFPAHRLIRGPIDKVNPLKIKKDY